MNFIKNNFSKGFSLVEVMITAGLMAGISLVISQMSLTGFRSSKNIEQKLAVNNSQAEIRGFLSVQTICAENFLTLNPTAPNSKNSLFVNGSERFKKNTLFDTGIKINSITFGGGFNQIGPDPRVGETNLIIDYTVKGVSGTESSISKKISLLVTIDAGSAVTKCHAFNGDSESSVPIGTVVDFAGDTAPSGWLLCQGQEISRGDYPDLFNAIGTTYGAGDGATTFILPDLRGRVVAGKDNMGGASADRLTAAYGSPDGDVLGAAAGSESHVLTVNELAQHYHNHTHGYVGSNEVSYQGTPLGQSPGTIASTIAWPGGTIEWINNDNGAIMGWWPGIHDEYHIKSFPRAFAPSIQNSGAWVGANLPHNNVQPTIILNKIIKY